MNPRRVINAFTFDDNFEVYTIIFSSCCVLIVLMHFWTLADGKVLIFARQSKLKIEYVSKG